MKAVSASGFSTMKKVQKSESQRKALTFQKCPYGELENAQLETLKRLRINEESYSLTDLELFSIRRFQLLQHC